MKFTAERLAIPVLILLTLFAFAPALQTGFTNLDDNVYLTQNPKVFGCGWENIRRIFTQPHEGQYGPLVLLSWAAEYPFHGLDPFGYHAVNILLHLLNTVLVYFLFGKLGGRGWPALVTALLFAVHPMNAEAVVPAYARKDVLFAAFYLMALILYVDHRRIGGAGRYAGSLVCGALSLMSKPSAVTLPLIMILIDGFLIRDRHGRRMRRYVPFLVLSALFVLITLRAHPAAHQQPWAPGGWGLAFLQVCDAPLFYLRKLIAPIGLSQVYPLPEAGTGPAHVFFTASPLILAVVTAAFVWIGRRYPLWLFGWLFLLIGLLPTLPFVRFHLATVADRYAYLPFLGFFYAASKLLDAFYGRSGVRAAVAALVLVMVIGVRLRCPVWTDSKTLWSDVLSKYPNVAFAYLRRGDHFTEQHDYASAIIDYSHVIRLRPDRARGFTSRGAAYYGIGDHDRALADLDRALGMDPSDIYALNNRAIVFAGKKEPRLAFNDLKRALELDPQDKAARSNLRQLFSEFPELDQGRGNPK